MWENNPKNKIEELYNNNYVVINILSNNETVDKIEDLLSFVMNFSVEFKEIVFDDKYLDDKGGIWLGTDSLINIIDIESFFSEKRGINYRKVITEPTSESIREVVYYIEVDDTLMDFDPNIDDIEEFKDELRTVYKMNSSRIETYIQKYNTNEYKSWISDWEDFWKEDFFEDLFFPQDDDLI